MKSAAHWVRLSSPARPFTAIQSILQDYRRSMIVARRRPGGRQELSVFEHFKKRHYKVCYTNKMGMPSANRTTRRSVAFQIMRQCKDSGCSDIVLWQRPRSY